MTHAIYNILSYVIRSAAAGNQGNGSSNNISVNMSLKTRYSNDSVRNNYKNSIVYVTYEISFRQQDMNLVLQLYYMLK